MLALCWKAVCIILCSTLRPRLPLPRLPPHSLSPLPPPPHPHTPLLSGQALGKRLPFAFLADAAQQFEGRYGAVAGGAIAYEMNTQFAPVLRERMHFFTTDPR